MLKSSDSIAAIVPPNYRQALQQSEIESLGDLLNHLPKRHENRQCFDAFPAQASEHPVCLRAKVIDAGRSKTNGQRSSYEIKIQDQKEGVFGAAFLTLRWFNMPYIKKLFAAGQEIIVYGKIKQYGGRLIMDHPDFERIDQETYTSLHVERIVPIYKNISGINQRQLREWIFETLQQLSPDFFQEKHQINPDYSYFTAYKNIHFPEKMQDAAEALRFFALEEFFYIQLRVCWQKHHYRQQQGRILGKKKSLLRTFYQQLPFDLTNAQKRSVKEIATDMQSPAPMHRMLQGDVGSGKTLVALCVALLAVESGVQVALMAPTQILAQQHYNNFSQSLKNLDIELGLCLGNRVENIENAQILIGTHALLHEKGTFTDLGLVIVDEQHKFGVNQRAALIKKGGMPDVLVMTATPIPRTLTMTLYGHLDVSLLDERPKGRGKIITGMRINPNPQDVSDFLTSQLKRGRQIYIVYPLVEKSEALKIESAATAYEKWIKRLQPHTVSLLHGKMKNEEKERIMSDFHSGKNQVLIATSVIEVGVDVPNANVMLIYHAERFGLAQLHQLRGRIGRGEHKSYCVLITENKQLENVNKLQTLVDHQDGFKIAESDLRLRGPGEVMGTQQSGLGDLRFPHFLSDTALIKKAHQLAFDLIQQDPNLDKHPNLQNKIQSTLHD